MTSPNASIFRTEALEYRLEHQGQRHSEVTFPRWMARTAVVALWILLAALGVGGGAACFASIPVTASGMAMVMAEQNDGSTSVAVLMPVDALPHLHPGDAADIFIGGSGEATRGTITSVEPAPLDATGIERRLNLPAGSMAALDAPVMLVWVDVASPADGVVAGSAGRAELPVGSRRAGTFLPLIGRFF